MNKNIIYAIIGIVLSILLSIFVVCFVNWKWNFEQMNFDERLFIVLLSICGIGLTFVLISINEDIKRSKLLVNLK